MKINTLLQSIIFLLILMSFLPNMEAQRKSKKQKVINSNITFDESLYSSLEWRNVGPWRGGRSAAVTGVAGQPNLFYFGAAGGGIWRTKDGGRHWNNISDGFFGGSIGAIAVSDSDPNVIYVGGGEVTVRGNVSSGNGIWKSVNAGKTWTSMGLENSRHIPRIRIHPTNSDIVFAAVLGNIYTNSNDRGVYKSIDGGKSWKKVLFANADAGAVDLTFDPNNPRIMYASTWRLRRTPYSLESGGDGSGLWKSTDSGETWINISENKGLPKGTLGISGITVSPANSERVWAIIEAKEGGVFRSDDAGETWTKLNDDRNLRQRAWYYSRIYADPKDEDKVYVLNVRYFRSDDGGKTFKKFNSQHSDHHDLWIAPENPDRMVIGDDGGAQITYDGGETWSTYHNQPTAQFYRVTTDDHFPYRIYAAQQDNSTVRIDHRTEGGSISEKNWESTAGCECGHIAIDPLDNDIVYGGCYDGFLERKDHKTGRSRSISVWPDNPMGHGAEGMKYRFQWNFPVFFSPHNPKKLYAASNHLHVSYNEGQSWEIISPDLTRNDSTKLVSSGGPITKDNTSVEYYCTIFAAQESPREKDVLWVGSDDGLVHISKDAGQNWKNITPPTMPEWCMINSLEVDPHQDGSCYLAATSYKTGDFKPYLFKTKDYGQTWTKITNGIKREDFTRVIRVDPIKKDILYTGTENGMYISFDDGNNWQSFQLNLPQVPITDLTIKNNNLIAATQGRSLWIIDDLTVLHQLSSDIQNKEIHLFQPMPTYRMGGYQNKKVKNQGMNHPSGVMVHYHIKEWKEKDTVSLTFTDMQGDTIQTFHNHANDKKEKIEVKEGANLFTWNMLYEGAKKFDGMILWWANMNGPKATPGQYQVHLNKNGASTIQTFEILQNPISESSEKDIQAQFDFSQSIINKVTEAHEAIIEIRDIRSQMNNYLDRLGTDSTYQDLRDLATTIDSTMTEIEEALYQTKNQSPQDPLNFPIRLTNKLAHLNSLNSGDYPPTDQAIAVRDELIGKIDAELMRFETVKTMELPKFNTMVKQKAIDAIILKEK